MTVWVGGLGLLLLLASAVAAFWFVRHESSRRRARLRLETSDSPRVESRRTESVFGRVPFWAAAVVWGLATGFGLAFGWGAILATGAGAVAGVLVHLALDSREQSRAIELEEGLAEVIGLATSALRSGASPVDALERAASAVRGPARVLLMELSGRLRLGEEVEAALAGLADRIPLESYRLFALALSVQWRAGGSLERSMASVSRAVRDRVEVQRRIHTQGAPTRGTVFAFVIATVGIAFLMWQNDPANLERFLASATGSTLVGVAIWLQAIGVLWMWRLSQIRI